MGSAAPRSGARMVSRRDEVVPFMDCPVLKMGMRSLRTGRLADGPALLDCPGRKTIIAADFRRG